MKKYLLWFLGVLIIGGLGLTLLLLVLAIDSKPLVLEGETLTADDVERIKQQWEEHDPQRMLPGQTKNLIVTERDLNLFFTYASSRGLGNRLKARAELYQGSAYFWSTLTLPFQLFGSYLNVSGMMTQRAGNLRFTEIRAGALPVPAWISNMLVQSMYRRVQLTDEYGQYADIVQAVKTFQFQQGRLLVVYQWRPDMAMQIQSQGQSLLLSADDQARLRVYNARLGEITQSLPGSSASLTALFRPLFSLAKQRSDSGEDAIADSRAIVLLLALYVNKQPIRKFVDSDDASLYPQAKQVSVTVFEREDLAQHFLTSAAIAASADSGVAEALGVFKELDDSQGGSGFSFADLAADRAGVRFAELVARISYDAQQAQRRLSEMESETEFMPRVDNLPEDIMALELKQQYDNLESDAYRMLNAEIDRRIADCWLYH
jgi:hypothetical protein